MLKHWNWFPEG